MYCRQSRFIINVHNSFEFYILERNIFWVERGLGRFIMESLIYLLLYNSIGLQSKCDQAFVTIIFLQNLLCNVTSY